MNVNCLVLGNPGVGKTSLINRIVDGYFKRSSPPSQFELVKTFTLDDVTFHVHETSYPKNLDCAIILYDTSLESWYSQVIEYYEALMKEFSKIQVVICGSKCDIKRRQHDPQMVRFMYMHPEIEFMCVSAKTGYDHKEPFKVLAEKFNH